MSTVVIIVIVAVVVVGVLYVKSQSGAPTKVQIQSGASASAPPTPKVKQNWLIGKGGELDGKAFHLAQRSATIGRAPSNFIQVNDPKVSRQQCQVKPHADGFEVIDMTSTNAMLVNGEGVNRAVLKDGDMLQLGATAFIFRAEGDFGPNAAWEPKAAGAGVRNTTAQMTAEEATRLAAAWKAYEAHDKDLDAAAASMGIPPEALQTLLDQ